MEQTPLEAAVLERLLAGEHPVLARLREQVSRAEVVERDLTGVGFFTSFRVPASSPLDPVPGPRLVFGDVHATIDGLVHGAGFLLYVESGFVTTLEGYCYGETWPEGHQSFELRYESPERESLWTLLTDVTDAGR